MLSTAKGSLSLYMQIKDLLAARIGRGDWLPGSMIPSEVQLARELGVSQGTVRQAITELVEKNILTRKQGRGTFVSTHDEDRALFHFFHITDDAGAKVLPESRVLHCRRKTASRKEASLLGLASKARIIHIERLRVLKDQPTILEIVVLPARLFGDLGLGRDSRLPNTLYQLYEKEYGITIYSARERLKAVAASPHDACLLRVEAGSPLLEIERVALTLDNSPVELRISRCNTARHCYENTIY